MIVKFFKAPKSGNGKGSVYYLLDKRVKENTSRLLYGSKREVLELIDNIDSKYKTTVGCLSFEEKNIDEKAKHQIMREFERQLLPGLEKEKNYKILWVEHTDKNRLELNFVIPRIELETGRHLSPYYYKSHQKAMDNWRELTNLHFGFSQPNDPQKEKSKEHTKIRKSNEIHNKLEQEILENIYDDKIKNRDDLIDFVNSKPNFKVTRTGKEYISIKEIIPNKTTKARRYKGVLYNERFRDIGTIRTELDRKKSDIATFNGRSTEEIQQRIRRLQNDTREYRKFRARQLQESIGKLSNDTKQDRTNHQGEHQGRDRHEIKRTNTDQERDIGRDREQAHSMADNRDLHLDRNNYGYVHRIQLPTLESKKTEKEGNDTRRNRKREYELRKRAIANARTRQRKLVQAERESFIRDTIIKSEHQELSTKLRNWSRTRTEQHFAGLRDLIKSVCETVSSTVHSAISAFGHYTTRITNNIRAEQKKQQQRNREQPETQSVRRMKRP